MKTKGLALFQKFLPKGIRHRLFRSVEKALICLAQPTELNETVNELVQIFDWIHSRNFKIVTPYEQKQRTRSARLTLLLDCLDQNTELRLQVTQRLRELIHATPKFNLLTSAGLPRQRSLLQAVLSRFQRNFLFNTVDQSEASEILSRLFRHPKEAAWWGGLSDELSERVFTLVSGEVVLNEKASSELWDKFEEGLCDAVLVLASDVRSLGLSEDFRLRTELKKPRESAPFQLSVICENWMDHRQAKKWSESAQDLVQFRNADVRCHESMNQVFKHMEEFGVDVDLVYRLERLSGALERLRQLIDFVESNDRLRFNPFVGALSRATLEDRSISSLLESNFRLLSRKIVERAGVTGEHYIVRSSQESIHMLGGAVGGGFVTVATVALKMLGMTLGLPLFFEFTYSAFNYSLSFLLMQVFGFKLATKQPAMTAAALAARLQDFESLTFASEAFVREVVQITRSQWVSIVGNLGAVIPGAFLFDWFYHSRFGHSFLNENTAHYVLHSLHPTQSLTIFYAALTGVMLWLASIGAGIAENWVVFHQVSKAIEKNSRIRRWLGKKNATRLAHLIHFEAGGIGGNISLGSLLAGIPLLGKFFGIPLDVRHVTLSTGAVALAVSALSFEKAASYGLWPSIAGIAIIGILNFSVSFLLALWIAMGARNVRVNQMGPLLMRVLKRFLRHPGEFFVAPKKYSN